MMNGKTLSAAIGAAKPPASIIESMLRTDRTLIEIKLYEAKLRARYLAELIRRENKRGRIEISTNVLNGYGFDPELDDLKEETP